MFDYAIIKVTRAIGSFLVLYSHSATGAKYIIHPKSEDTYVDSEKNKTNLPIPMSFEKTTWTQTDLPSTEKNTAQELPIGSLDPLV